MPHIYNSIFISPFLPHPLNHSPTIFFLISISFSLFGVLHLLLLSVLFPFSFYLFLLFHVLFLYCFPFLSPTFDSFTFLYLYCFPFLSLFLFSFFFFYSFTFMYLFPFSFPFESFIFFICTVSLSFLSLFTHSSTYFPLLFTFKQILHVYHHFTFHFFLPLNLSQPYIHLFTLFLIFSFACFSSLLTIFLFTTFSFASLLSLFVLCLTTFHHLLIQCPSNFFSLPHSLLYSTLYQSFSFF
ncbi:unnamed protein product [Acanthosepion pharaonis]|uniref:Uncharacterized protein n=1 Tax=Acanthosepion pharaonis TaxID=158019 RepID=A0A812CEZ9_ACAPH|nr:unnamed protein product [Sepia pharaonis]